NRADFRSRHGTKLAITRSRLSIFQVNNVSNTAKSRRGVSAGSPQAPVSRARAEQHRSALERTAGWFHRLVQGRSTPAKAPITKRGDVADDPLAAFASEDAPVSVNERSI